MKCKILIILLITIRHECLLLNSVLIRQRFFFSLFQFHFERFRKTVTSLNVNIPEIHGLKSLCTKYDISVIFPKHCKPWSNIRKALKIVPEKANI